MSNPTNRELNTAVATLKNHIDEKVADINEKIGALTVQVKTTNGTVKNLQLWRSFIVGGLSVISAVVIPLLVYIYLSSQHDQNLQQAIINATQQVTEQQNQKK